MPSNLIADDSLVADHLFGTVSATRLNKQYHKHTLILILG